MRVIQETRGTRALALVAGGVFASLGLPACGGDDFENEPRPPVALGITGVITEDEVTVSPSRFGAGPIVLTVSNQTPQSHRVSLSGRDETGTEIREITGPVNPQDTATIQQTLPEGNYRVGANSDGALTSGIEPDRLTVGPPRSDASDELELP
jgi:hypothetical protein